MEKLIQVSVLSFGGILGVNARYWFGLWVNRWTSHPFPWATFLINVSGSFAIGFLATLLASRLPHPNVRLLVITGFLGGYTTYSSYAFESLTLWERGEKGLSVGYMASTLLAGFLAVFLGVALARSVVVPNAERSTPSDVRPSSESGADTQTVVSEPEGST
jgi:CrcB protein